MTPITQLIVFLVCGIVANGHIANHLFGGDSKVPAGGEDLDLALKSLPKVELHAHLHGSIRKETLLDFVSIAASASNSSGSKVKLTLEDYDHITADTPFALFPIIHQLITSIDQVKRILIEMMDDYRQQGTIYLEIRSTPRSLSSQVSISDYLQALVDTIGDYNTQHRQEMLVKLIVSIDRSSNLKNAMEIIQLAEQLAYYERKAISVREKIIVGVDFSGNPLGGRFQDFAEVFTKAVKKGFNTTVHAAEMKDLSETSSEESIDETSFILNYKPDRLGHMLYLKDTHFDLLKKLNEDGKPPLIEICPSTAFTLMSLGSYADHPHIRKLASLRYPFSFATDDSGIFNTNLTQEIRHMAHAIEFSLPDLVQIQATSLEYAFVTHAERQLLEQVFQQYIGKLKEAFPYLMEREEDKMDMSSLYTM